ncbi:hypothetical protein P154DRAFT_445049 [Amniculicola lignicola CBS 123094]|uniref:Rhodopsin domain-containing protein n=1 Tax=Amniculicola lignicola CBS 123094 TaxID=1392246 RepID=A0A6A5W3S9_9PLEO|nr:hypothetical protein P154DRAFT_445049 [Amniculicola lignicola CBS 123094]
MSQQPTDSEIQYMLEHAGDDLRPAMIAGSAVAGAMAVVFVALRVAARKLPGIPFGADDWWMFASLFLFLGTPISFAWTTRYGAGRHVIALTDPKAFSIISLLYLYRRIFPQQWFQRVLLAFGIFLTVMAITSILVSLLQCIPMEKMWNPEISGRCVQFGKFALAMSCINISTDVFMFALPLPVVWGLQINKNQKWLVSLSFIMGGSACIVYLIRLLFVLKVASTPDPTWDSIPSGIASTFELSVGIFAASFPTYRPLYRWFSKGTFDDTTARSGSWGSRGPSIGRFHAQRPDPNYSIKLTSTRSEAGLRDTDEERLYVIRSDVFTNQNG